VSLVVMLVGGFGLVSRARGGRGIVIAVVFSFDQQKEDY